MVKLAAEHRKNLIITAAVKIANNHGTLTAITWYRLEQTVMIATSQRTMRYHFKSMKDLLDIVGTDSRLIKECKDQAREMGILK